MKTEITKYYVDTNGRYLGGFCGKTNVDLKDAVEIAEPPANGLDRWDGQAWIPYVEVPTSVLMHQFRLALFRRGHLPVAEAAIGAMAGDPGVESRIEWEFSPSVARSGALVRSLAAALKIEAPEMDGIFVMAATL